MSQTVPDHQRRNHHVWARKRPLAASMLELDTKAVGGFENITVAIETQRVSASFDEVGPYSLVAVDELQRDGEECLSSVDG